LVDGFAAGTLRTVPERNGAALLVEPFAPLPPEARTALEDEGARLLAFAANDTGAHDVHFAQ